MKKDFPSIICRASASEPGILVSASSHMPPTGMNLPSATRRLMRS